MNNLEQIKELLVKLSNNLDTDNSIVNNCVNKLHEIVDQELQNQSKISIF